MKARILAALLLGGALSLAAVSANAAISYNWKLTASATPADGGFAEVGSGTLTTTVIGGVDTITSITGEIGGSAITGLTTTQLFGFYTPDNLFFSDTLLDTKGLGVETASGQEINIESFYAPGAGYHTGNAYDELIDPIPAGQAYISAGVGSFSVTAVPEPSVWALFIAGVFGIGALVRRRARSTVALGQTA